VGYATRFNAEGRNAVVRVRERRGGKETEDRYFVSRVPADFGAGFLVEKVGAPESSYHVNLSGAQSSCECKGFLRWGRCRHVEGLAALHAAGRL
jgi:hypothetical protein